MRPKVTLFGLVALAAALHTGSIAAQTSRSNRVPNPAYLGQFPSVDRVKAELKGTNPMDTAARQMGAFWQLQEIIKDLSGPRADRNELSPGENELIGAYRGGYQNAEQSYASPPDKAK